MALYLHEMAHVRPGMMLKYWDAIQEHLLPLTKHSPQKALGMWRSELQHTEMIWLWATDSWQGFVDRVAQNLRNPQMEKWVYETGVPYRYGWTDKLMNPVAFCPEPERILGDEAMQGRLYLHRTLEIGAGQTEPYLQLVDGPLRAAYEKAGFVLVGCWETAEGTGTHGEVVHLWNLGDWRKWGAYQEAARQQGDWRELYEQERAMAGAIFDRLLQPAPFSPLGGRFFGGSRA